MILSSCNRLSSYLHTHFPSFLHTYKYQDEDDDDDDDDEEDDDEDVRTDSSNSLALAILHKVGVSISSHVA